MITSLFPFQQKAVDELRYDADEAIANYAKKRKPQVIPSHEVGISFWGNRAVCRDAVCPFENMGAAA